MKTAKTGSVYVFCEDDLFSGVQSALAAEFNIVRGSFSESYIRKIEAEGPAKGRIKAAIVEYFGTGLGQYDFLASVLKACKIPFVCVCRQAKDGFFALKSGASKMLVVPGGLTWTIDSKGLSQKSFFIKSLVELMRNICESGDVRALKHLQLKNAPYKKVILIGASTGGSEAVTKVLTKMPFNCPPIIVALHMPPVFTRMFAERTNSLTKITCWEGEDGDRLCPGLALVVPGSGHGELRKDQRGFFLNAYQGQPIRHVRPSVDLLFSSAAGSAGRDAMGVILTGMGKDGAEGLLAMRRAGAFTIGQDEASSVVYGMPKAAYDAGAVCAQFSLENIASKILENV